MHGPLPVLLLAAALATAPTASARTCGEDDLDVIQAILGELDDLPGGPRAPTAGGPAERDLAAAALEAGCEWSPAPGGALESLERMRWRDGGAGPGPHDLAVDGDGAPWWRIFLPRLELRWAGSFEEGRRGGGTHDGWSGRFELWVLWTVVPSW
ncbi:MAG: hypothetical protein HY907_11155 [Deltaproteobacteria bacterium]|nr:hypothetical protein [Deltaproteobacteria bacterium]